MRNSTTYKLTGTKTFRLSSSKILGKYGSNLQNIEKSMREIYVPDEGKIFVQTDASGAEAMIVAYLCRNGNFRKLFIHGIKPHVYVAIHMFKDVWPKKLHEKGFLIGEQSIDMNEVLTTPIEKLKELPLWKSLDACIKDSDNWPLTERYYYLSKQACHSGNYGITAPTFRMNVLEKSGGKIVISKSDSEFFISTYHRLFPELREDFHANVQRNAVKNKLLYNLHGHPYQITQPYIKEADYKELYSWIPQSSVGELTNIAFAALQKYIEDNNKNWDLLANTHDSYLCQCPIIEVMECATMMKTLMEQTFTSPFDGTKFAMKSETQAGFCWRPYHKDKCPNGLKEVKI